tara:strand:+ start:2078 stop:2407 length:330 start_codon:yes stop_codon:yes gene_type:complete
MSVIKILSYTAQPYGEHQLGFAIVEMGKNAKFILKVCKSKAGHPFCTFQTIKLKDQWVPLMEFTDPEFTKKFFAECNLQIKPLIPSPKQEFNSDYPNMDEPEQTQGAPF